MSSNKKTERKFTPIESIAKMVIKNQSKIASEAIHKITTIAQDGKKVELNHIKQISLVANNAIDQITKMAQLLQDKKDDS